jgi:hypothetical protein
LKNNKVLKHYKHEIEQKNEAKNEAKNTKNGRHQYGIRNEKSNISLK